MGEIVIQQSCLCMANVKITRRLQGKPHNNPIFSVFQANIVVCTGCTCCSLSLPHGIAEVCDNSCDPRIGNLNELKPMAYVDAVPTEGGCHFVSVKSTPDCKSATSARVNA